MTSSISITPMKLEIRYRRRLRHRCHQRQPPPSSSFSVKILAKVVIMVVILILNIISVVVFMSTSSSRRSGAVTLSYSSTTLFVQATPTPTPKSTTSPYHTFIHDHVLSSTSSSSSSPQQQQMILQAIDKCRHKLQEDPNFVKANQMLSVLLESIAINVMTMSSSSSSVIDDNNEDIYFLKRLWQEVADLSWKAATTTVPSDSESDNDSRTCEAESHESNDGNNKDTATTTTCTSSSSSDSDQVTYVLDDTARVECLLRSAKALTYLETLQRQHPTSGLSSTGLSSSSSSPQETMDYFSLLDHVSITYRLVQVYRMVLPIITNVDDVEEILTRATPLFFSQTTTSNTLPTTMSTSTNANTVTDRNFQVDLVQLSNTLVDKFPTSIIIRQFQGATLRKVGELDKSCQAYILSARLAQQQFYDHNNFSLSDDTETENEKHRIIDQMQSFVTMVVKSQILAASSIKEAKDNKRQSSTQVRSSKDDDNDDNITIINDNGIEDAYQFLISALDILNTIEPKLKEMGDGSYDHTAEDYSSETTTIESSQPSAIDLLRVEVYNTLGVIHKAVGNTQQAIESFQRSFEYNPNDGHALVQLASLDALPKSWPSSDHTSNHGVKSLDRDYVRGLFDGYSNRFENELVSVLHYQGHEWVGEQLFDHINQQKPPADSSHPYTIVDLGCGTGLVGQYVQSKLFNEAQSKHDNNNIVQLLGVDLSPRMTDIARLKEWQRDRRVYDRVDEDDAVNYLSHLSQSSIDYIVAADVFIYIGDLDELFQLAYDALTDDGILVFSVELLPTDNNNVNNDNSGMKLLKSGRFGHSRGYIEKTATSYGFHITTWKKGILRMQRGEPVHGAVVVLSKK